eukprot:TRINITY_DN10036_c0_g1_i2.p1 TRINITY_DN10036_c0_g1~~TRINITY_DN10036_c0_g1_i2.p1  ORF type:complete len:326 (-),score=56.26 TRINITY_DN10036_c0_g1_i2:375-1352(-)
MNVLTFISALLASISVYFVWVLIAYDLGFQFLLVICLVSVIGLCSQLLWWKTASVSGKTVAVSGSSGLGLEIAVSLAKRGAARIVFVSGDSGNLDLAVSQIKQLGAASSSFTGDVSDSAAVAETFERIHREVGDIDVLVSNAGIVCGQPLLDASEAELRRVLDVNLMAQFWVCRAVLPRMVERKSGRVVLIASIAGMMSMNRLVEYCTSKFGVYGFAEGLRRELYGSNVQTTVVCPYIINTGMFEGTRPLPLLPMLKARDVARRVADAIEYGESYVVVPWVFHLMPLIRVLPVELLDFLARAMGGASSMDNFKGRGKEFNLKGVS